jgi:excisionase family DNA binding protein
MAKQGGQTMIGVDSMRPQPAQYKPETPCLSMRPREAAKALGISERLLWEWTDRGKVPHIRLGKAILYPVDSLRDWLKKQAQQSERKNFEKELHKTLDF